jgi:probable aminopeptidase NPEPL1
MPSTVTFVDTPRDLAECTVHAVLGRKEQLLAAELSPWRPSSMPAVVWTAMASRGEPGHDGSSRSTWLEGTPERAIVGVLPEVCSRHNAPSRSWAITRLCKTVGGGRVGIVVALSDRDHAAAAGLAVARAFPLYDATSKPREHDIRVALVGPDGRAIDPRRIAIAAEGVRTAASLVDMPPNELTTTAFVARARAVAERHESVSVYVIEGEELARQGLGGIWGVGRASVHPPALVALDHTPAAPIGDHDAWIGKGIVYDTGGLSIKSKTGMPGMKTDMGGAAAVLGAFESAVRLGARNRITAVLCIAENAVGPDATRPDDVLHMYSGRTVEVNNTDAEGRLCLADGLAWMGKHRHPDRIVDLATLTGAQGISTGKRHAALYCNNDALETFAVAAGKRIGDLTHPLPYAPEFFKREFASRVADMRNSVKDRSNAQSSCAGEFIRSHIHREDVPWLHVDMAAPSTRDGRGTGYGVGLLLALAGLT